MRGKMHHMGPHHLAAGWNLVVIVALLLTALGPRGAVRAARHLGRIKVVGEGPERLRRMVRGRP